MLRFSRTWAAWILAPVIFLLATSDSAAVTLTGTLQGHVTDEKGQPLPGVTVIARSEALIRERAATTDAQGNYFLSALAPGDYRVVAQMEGYVTLAFDTEVQLDKTTGLDIVMKQGAVTEQVTVTASRPVIDKTSTEMAPSITPEVTNELPVLRQYQSLLGLAPGVANTDESGGNPNILGGTSNSNVYLVDGVSGRDPVTGTFGFNLNFDAIEAVDLKLVGVSAEYGQFQGGLANVTTKSGSNEFTGSVRDEIDSPSWTMPFSGSTQSDFAPAFPAPPGCDPDDPDAPPGCFQYTRPSVPARAASNKVHDIQTTLGGPIVRDNAWFYISYNRSETTAPRTLGNPVGGPFGNGTYIRSFQGDFSLGKITWQATNNHKIQGQYTEDPANLPVCYGAEFFGGPCYEGYNVDFQEQGGNIWQANWNATWTPTLLSMVRVGHFKNHFAISPLQATFPRQDLIDALDVPGGNLGAGVEPAPFIDLFSTGSLFDATIFGPQPEDRIRDEAEASVTKFLEAGPGEHSLKAGIDLQKTNQVGSSIIAGNALVYGTFANSVVGLGGTADPYDINNRIYYLFYDFAPPGTGGPENRQTALYVQDDWSLNKHWAFNLGVRYEKSENENDTGEAVIDDSGFAPRLGAAFDVTGEGKYVVKATAARYLAGINLTTLSPFLRNAGGQSSYDFYFNLNFPAPGPPDWFLLSQVRSNGTFDPNLTPQYFDEYSLGYEHSFTPTFGAMLRAITREYKDTLTQRYSFSYDTGFPQKNIFEFNNPDAKRSFDAVMLAFDKRFADNWSLFGNYTWSKAEGNVTTEQGFSTFQSYPDVPQTTVNRFGLLPWDVKHLAKLYGEYRLPINSTRHALGIGAGYQYASGNPYQKFRNSVNVVVGPGPNGIQEDPLGTPAVDAVSDDQLDQVTQYFEPLGSRREPDWWSLDLQLNYKFSFSKDVVFESRFAVYNVTDEQTPLQVNTNWFDPELKGSDSLANYTFGFPAAYSQFQAPRSYSVQLGVVW